MFLYILIEFMEYPKEILVKDYFEIHNYYSKIYDTNFVKEKTLETSQYKGRTIILMQVGSFHEVYATDEDGVDLINLAQKLDICCTKKNGNLPLSKKNPRMLGFPISVTGNYIDKLIDLNYTVILIDQVTEPPNPTRKVTGIYSPATHIEKKTNKTTYLVSIVLDKIKDIKTNSYQLCIGLTAYDLATGYGIVYETYSKPHDTLLALDDTVRFIEHYPPSEIILENNLNDEHIANMSIDNILGYLNIPQYNIYTIKINQHKKISWQKLLLEKIYKIKSNICIIDYLGLQFLNWARLSLVILLDYVIAHQPLLLEKLKVPHIFSLNKYLYLGNRALEQLNVITNNANETSLLQIINYTKTAIGKRFLINQLSTPLIDPTEINLRYNLIEKILEKQHQNKLINFLEDIYDLDKLNRKLEINIINPYELYQIYLSFYQINKLIKYLDDNKLLNILDINCELVDKTVEIQNWINNRFILEKINGLNFNNFIDTDNSFYNKNINNDIDELQNKIDSSQNFITNLIKTLENFIEDKKFFKKDNDAKSFITLKYNDRDGHYLLITSRRCEILKKNLEKIQNLSIGSIKINISDLEFNELPKSSNTKINCKKIKELSTEIINYKLLLAKKLKEEFKNDMKTFCNLFGNILFLWSNKISFIDFINSGALCAYNNHYSKPTIVQSEYSFFQAKEIRHPIIEKISTNTQYVPHSIELGNNTGQNGILLYGINSSGKSTLMKSIGLNIILAQIGYYTAATNFKFSPYNSLFTRICGNDNIFRGLSSFMVEMMELMAILKRNNNKTLALCDEIAKGTEIISATVIVSYMLETLSKSGSSFITATHLHDLVNIKSLYNLKNIKIKHIKISYDNQNDLLIFDRHLSDGPGESFYGLQVAKYLMKDKHFNERTNELLKEYQNITNKVSKYNANVIIESCEICKSKNNLETHHIIWQKDFDENGINKNKFYLHKNDLHNLVVLCNKCHDKVDSGNIIINGWINTSEGKKFDYQLIEPEPEKKSKYSQELIDYIKSLYNKVDKQMAKIKIKEEYNKKITTKSILNIWNTI